MSKRKQRRERGASWLDNEQDDSSQPSLHDLTIDGYGLDIAPSQRIVARAVNIMHIVPSASQPRRTMPSAIRRHWDGGARTVVDALIAWQEAASEELNRELNAHDLIASGAEESHDDDAEFDAPPSSIAGAFLRLINLAASIYRDGLTNPVTVVKKGERYVLETGERRWLSFHLLNEIFPDADFGEIPARVMDEISIWRQASENNARADLNAISRARQFALLLMDLYGFENFKEYDRFRNEQDYYAQIADASAFRIPYGAGDKILNAMGVSHKSAFTRARAILQLPADVWRLGDDYNFSEDFLLQLSKLPADKAIKEAQKVASRNLSQPSEKGTSTRRKTSDDDRPKWQRQIDRAFDPRRWDKMPPEERREAYAYLKTMLIKLDEMGFGD